MTQPQKILTLQFKYFGDVVLMVPALRALRQHWPKAQLHVLVPAETAPLLAHLSWLDKVWAMPRTRGQARLMDSWPIIRALRREKFDRSVDFGGNDRGALLSRVVGARRRLGRMRMRGVKWRRLCYTEIAMPVKGTPHQAGRLASLLTGAWDVPMPDSLALEIVADPALADFARKLAPGHPLIFHVAAGKPKKEWPAKHWAELHRRAAAAGREVFFSSGTSARERALLEAVQRLAPHARALPPLANLSEFLAVLKRASLFVSGDTGPLHFAAGLGVPTIALFGQTFVGLWAPQGPLHRVLQAAQCTCPRSAESCQSTSPCMATISPEKVFELLRV